jgi:hypothetical protein
MIELAVYLVALYVVGVAVFVVPTPLRVHGHMRPPRHRVHRSLSLPRPVPVGTASHSSEAPADSSPNRRRLAAARVARRV